MTTEGVIVLLVVIAAVVWQFCVFCSNIIRIERIRGLFPDKFNNIDLLKGANGKDIIVVSQPSADCEVMVNDLNLYLTKNRHRTYDYQILREIVERNVEALNDEVREMLAAPLYIGLMATIVGIIFGVIYFANNGLENILGDQLLSTNDIRTLLVDIGIAMVASGMGVLFTNLATISLNSANSAMTKNKNMFLTWIQAELMPKANDNITDAINKMVANLNAFNNSFGQNTQGIREAMESVGNIYDLQIKLLEEIQSIDIVTLATVNIRVYNELKGCTEIIEKLTVILANAGEHIDNMNQREGQLQRQISSMDAALTQGIAQLKQAFDATINDLRDHFQQQIMMIQGMSDPFVEVKQTFDHGIQQMNSSFRQQNSSLQDLLLEQQQLLTDSLAQQRKAIEESLKRQDQALQRITQASKNADLFSQLQETLDKINTKLGKHWWQL